MKTVDTSSRCRLRFAREAAMSIAPCDHGIEHRAGFPAASHLPGRYRALASFVVPPPSFSAEYLSAVGIFRDRKGDEIPARGCLSLERESVGEAPPVYSLGDLRAERLVSQGQSETTDRRAILFERRHGILLGDAYAFCSLPSSEQSSLRSLEGTRSYVPRALFHPSPASLNF